MKSVCVYCGSSDKVLPVYLHSAKELGHLLAKHEISLVYGGGKTGVMGAVANGVLEAGGQVIGVIPEIFNLPHLVHLGLTKLEVVPDMHQRKARMAALADGFIALPGGFGTLEELFEALTWAQIGLHHKPIGLLNVDGYFDSLFSMIDHIFSEGFIYSEHTKLFVHALNPVKLLEEMNTYHQPGDLQRWVQRDA